MTPPYHRQLFIIALFRGTAEIRKVCILGKQDFAVRDLAFFGVTLGKEEKE